MASLGGSSRRGFGWFLLAVVLLLSLNSRPLRRAQVEARTEVGEPSGSLSFSASVSLNEFLPAPGEVDWDEDGTADSSDEWIELYNAEASAVGVGGWWLDDVAAGGSPSYRIPDGTTIAASGFLVFFKQDTGLSLNNGGDTVRLLWPDGTEKEAVSYPDVGSARDVSYSKTVDGGTSWTTTFPPSPGGSNQPATPTPPPTPTASSTASSTPVSTGTSTPAWTPTYTPSPTLTATASPTATPTSTPSPTEAPTLTSTATESPTSTSIPTPSPTLAHTPTGTATATPVLTAISTRTPSPTPTVTGGSTATATQTGTATATPRETATTTATGTSTLIPTPTGTHSPTPTATPTYTVLPAETTTATASATPFSETVFLNEFMPAPLNVDWDGNGTANSNDEWIELYSAGPDTVDLSGWQLDDVAEGGTSPYTIPDGTVIPAWGFLLLCRRDTGIILNNGGDTVRLLRPDGSEQETKSYPDVGSDRDVSYSKTMDGGTDWTTNYPPSPGESNQPAASTTTPNPSPTGIETAIPTTTPTPTEPLVVIPDTVFLNEFLPAPAGMDWDGDGTADSDDEWIELYNSSLSPVDIGGWQLDDAAAGGTGAHRIPDGTTIPAVGFRVFYKKDTGIALNNGGDTVRLIRPDGSEAETKTYPGVGSGRDISYSKTMDGGSAWTTGYPPSPGGPNGAGPATSTPTPTPLSSTWTPTATQTSIPDQTPTTLTTLTPTGTAPAPESGKVLINEVLYDAPQAGSDGVYEWFELYNTSDSPVSLDGWSIGDNNGADDLGRATTLTLRRSAPLIPPHAVLVVAASTEFHVNFPHYAGPIIYVSDGKIGNGLSNAGDRLILSDPSGRIADALSYGDDGSVFDPPAPDVPAGHSLERIAAGYDSGSAADFTDREEPSPGEVQRALTPTSTSTSTPTSPAAFRIIFLPVIAWNR